MVMHTAALADTDLVQLRALGARLVATDLLPTSPAFNTRRLYTADAAYDPLCFVLGWRRIPSHQLLTSFSLMFVSV